VKAGLGLVPHEAARSLEDVSVDLFSAVSREAVQHDVLPGCVAEQLSRYPHLPEILQPALLLALLAHAREDVGAHHVGVTGGQPRILHDLHLGTGGARLFDQLGCGLVPARASQY